MAWTLVDLYRQVQKVLPVMFGGTGNTRGWATDTVIGAYVNGTGLTIERGTVVQLAAYIAMGGLPATDSRIKPTTTAAQQNVLGVVVGRFRTTFPFNEYEDADAADGDVAAVCILGKARTTVAGSVDVGMYAYTSATDGAAEGNENLQQAAFGTWESGGSGTQTLRLWGAPTTPGNLGSIFISFGDGITVIEPLTTWLDVPIPFNMRLIDWTMYSKDVGSISIGVYSDTYSGFPPVATDDITGDSTPSMSTALKATGVIETLTGPLGYAGGWTETDIVGGDMLRFMVESASGTRQVSILFRYLRN